MLVFPLLGHALGMSQQSFGLFAGTAVNDTSSVVATATTYGAAATSHAVVVKLVRTLMIIPICLGLAGLTARRQGNPPVRPSELATPVPRGGSRYLPPAPPSMAPAEARARTPADRGSTRLDVARCGWSGSCRGSSSASSWRPAVNSAGVIPAGAHGPLQHVSVFLVAVALSAIGLSTNVAALRKAGPGRCCSARCCGSRSPPPAWACRPSPAPSADRVSPQVRSPAGDRQPVQAVHLLITFDHSASSSYHF